MYISRGQATNWTNAVILLIELYENSMSGTWEYYRVEKVGL